MELSPIGIVINNRKEVKDDNWGSVESIIQLSDNIIEDAFEGIDAFSHLHIIFYMNKVSDEKALAQYRHPRNDDTIPKVGTFAQRNKNRPNKIGLTTVKLIRREKNKIYVTHLDAIDGTPVLDIKPVFKEFLPQEEVKQPDWTHGIMKNYW